MAAQRGVVDSLRAIVAPIYGLALANTVLVLVRDREHAGLPPLDSVSVSAALYSAVLVATVARFYHGNNMHLTKFYGRPGARREPAAKRPKLLVDFSVIFGQSIIFALLSFYAEPRGEFVALILALLLVDIAWFAYNGVGITAPAALKHMLVWQYNNFFHVFAIGICYLGFVYSGHEEYLHVGVVFLTTNTVIDFAWNRGHYRGAFDD